MVENKKKEGSCTCKKCNRTILERNFYKNRQGERVDQCKDCMTLHLNNFQPETFMWILQKLDYPYIPTAWNVIRDKVFAENPKKMAGTAVLGKYISKMRLMQWKNHGWADSQMLEAKEQKKMEEAEGKVKQAVITSEYAGLSEPELREKVQMGEITLSEYRSIAPIEDQYRAFVEGGLPRQIPTVNTNPFAPKIYEGLDIPNPAQELEKDDILYLLMKWGKEYSPEEWIELEKSYKEIENACEYLDPDTKHTLILICKTSLKANQSLDIGDIDSFQKLSRVLDTLRKSANLTAVQKKKDREEGERPMTSVGELVAYLEKNGGKIPSYKIDAPYDIIDKIISDQKEYTKNLIYRDTALAKQIEDYIKRKEAIAGVLEREDEREAGNIYEITDGDFSDHIMTEQELALQTARAAALEEQGGYDGIE